MTERIPLHGEEFTSHPDRVYERLRSHGPVVPVELEPGVPAMLVVDYDTALQVLRSPHVFAKDSRRWLPTAPPEAGVLPMMAWRMMTPDSIWTFGMMTLSSTMAPESTVQPVEMMECVMVP